MSSPLYTESPPTPESSPSSLNTLINSRQFPLVMFKIPGCVNCSKLTNLLMDIQTKCEKAGYTTFNFDIIDLATLEEDANEGLLVELCKTSGGKRTFPKLFCRGMYVGDYNDIRRKYAFDGMQDILNQLGISNLDEF